MKTIIYLETLISDECLYYQAKDPASKVYLRHLYECAVFLPSQLADIRALAAAHGWKVEIDECTPEG